MAGRGAAYSLHAGVKAGVVELDGEVVRFTHPLLASVLLQALGAEEKRRLHRRLALVVVDESERAQHLGLAAHRPSARVAGVLESASRREMDRGAPTAAAELLRLAADLVPERDRERRHTDLLEAARLHAMGGAMMLAQDLAGSVLSDRPTGAVASEARLLLAELTPNVEGHLRATEAVLAEKRADPAIRSRAAALASQTRFITGDLRGALDLARAALRWATASRNPRLIVIASCSLAILETWAGHETPGLLESTFEIAATNHSYLTYQNNPLVVRGLRHLYRDELTEARHALEAALEEAREHGDVDGVAGVLFHLAELECRAADFGAAVARANEFVLLSEQLGYDQSLGAALYAFALAQAHIGNVDVAREAVGNGLRIAGEVGDWVMSIQHHGVLGFLELSLGNFEAAAHELRALPGALLAHGIREPSVFPVWPNAIESLMWIGDLSEADALLATYVSLADELDCPWARATAARCEGLLAATRGDLVSAEEVLARALIAHERVPSAFERARTQLALGSVLRRAKRRREARAILAQAEATLRDLGAERWAERVAAEAARIGGRRAGGPGLSATEEEVARLVGVGHTNREVAAALFVTERTVEANLSSIYAKLGIRSRTELTRAILTGDRRPAP